LHVAAILAAAPSSQAVSLMIIIVVVVVVVVGVNVIIKHGIECCVSSVGGWIC